MAVPRVAIHRGRELLFGPRRGAAAANRLRQGVSLDRLRADVRADWEEELERLEAAGAFPGRGVYSGYLGSSPPSPLGHLPPGLLAVGLQRRRSLAAAP